MTQNPALTPAGPAISPEEGGTLPVRAETLDEGAAALVAAGVAAETRRAYAGDLARYTTWCHSRGLEVFPATPERLVNYVAHLADSGKSPATIERALAAVTGACRLAGMGRPDTKAARVAIRAVRRSRAETGVGIRKAPAVSIEALRAMVATTDDTLLGLRDRAVIVLGFAAMLRRSELAALDVTDVEESDDGLTLTIRHSKTDQAGVGALVAVPHGTQAATCPVRTLRAWTATAGLGDGALFRRVDRHGRLLGPLTGQAVAIITTRAAQAAGLPGRHTGHSLRRGGATAARKAGHDHLTIARHGRWKDGSPVLLGYLETTDRWTTNPMTGTGL